VLLRIHCTIYIPNVERGDFVTLRSLFGHKNLKNDVYEELEISLGCLLCLVPEQKYSYGQGFPVAVTEPEHPN